MKKRWVFTVFGFIAVVIVIAGTFWMFSDSANEGKDSNADENRANEDLDSTEIDIFSSIPAFPGAEGPAKYITGGRGGEVYKVTTLADTGPGSFRDAVSGDNRIIVFDVSGTIQTTGSLNITGSNLTIAGQTAPGDGITIYGNQVTIKGDNIILQHLRFRTNDKLGGEPDTLTARNVRGILIDHCSFTWGIDEVLSIYQSYDVTIQWSIIGESLTMSNHSKGRHGYGGIIGGNNIMLHHNLYLHHSSRVPRFAGNETGNDLIDYRNNVAYNWGFNSAYGGADSDINMIANYYKSGPDTRESVKSRIYQTDEGTNLFVSDNAVEGFPDVTADNVLGIDQRAQSFSFADQPFGDFNIETDTAETAYEKVLSGAGATVPRRDAIDARLVYDVLNGTGRLINTPLEVGGVPELKEESGPADEDEDGIPDAWEIANGLDPNDAGDAMKLRDDGYTNLEIYIHSLTNSRTDNPAIKITSPTINETFLSLKDITIKAEAEGTVENRRIDRVEFYVNGKYLGQSTRSPYEYTWRNVPDGTYYLTARAIDTDRMMTLSSAVVIHVNDETLITPWERVDIGDVPVPGAASLISGVLQLKTSGNISGREDHFTFVYQPFEGDGTFTALMQGITAVDDGASAGIMMRSSLDSDSPMAYLQLRFVKGGIDNAFEYRSSRGGTVESERAPARGFPAWFKLERDGNLITGFASRDGEEWEEIASQRFDSLPDTIYVGLAANAVKVDNAISNVNTAKFSNMELTEK